jgi:hypothetical protein
MYIQFFLDKKSCRRYEWCSLQLDTSEQAPRTLQVEYYLYGSSATGEIYLVGRVEPRNSRFEKTSSRGTGGKRKKKLYEIIQVYDM